MISLQHISPFCGTNQGGLYLLRIIPAYNVESIPEPVQHIIPTALDLVDPAHYADVWFTTGGFTEQMQEDANGEYFRQQIQIYTPKDDPDVAFAIDQLTGVRCVGIYLDGNGQAKLIGSLQAPLTFSSDLDTGNDSADKNGHKLVFKTESTHKAYFYQMFEGGTPPARKVFSYLSFNAGYFNAGFLTR